MDIFSYLLGKKAGGGGTANLQSKEVTITQNGETTIQADEGYDGLSSVSITTNVPRGIPEYQELQYITSSKQQYIDTGVKAANNIKIIFEAAYQSGGGALFGSSTSDDTARYYVASINSSLSFFYTGAYIQSDIYYTIRTSYEITSTETKMNNNIIGTYTISEYPLGNIYIFGASTEDGTPLGLCNARLYSFKIYEGDTLIRDFIPVRVIGFGTICLYDKVEGKYYFNLGTGDFTAGEPVE